MWNENSIDILFNLDRKQKSIFQPKIIYFKQFHLLTDDLKEEIRSPNLK